MDNERRDERVQTGPCGYTHKPLNPWVTCWPACGCANPDYDASMPRPRSFAELLDWVGKRNEKK